MKYIPGKKYLCKNGNIVTFACDLREFGCTDRDPLRFIDHAGRATMRMPDGTWVGRPCLNIVAEYQEPWLPVAKQKALAELGYWGVSAQEGHYPVGGTRTTCHELLSLGRSDASYEMIHFQDQPWYADWLKEREGGDDA